MRPLGPLRVAALALLFAAGARAQDKEARAARGAYREGEEYLEKKEYGKAYERLYKAFLENPADIDTNFALGRAAFELGRYEEAAMAFERILIARPDLPRVRLELARCYFRLKSYDLAKRYFSDVLATNPPEQVRRNVQAMLSQIGAAARKDHFSGVLSVGYNWDSNPRSSPGNERIGGVLGPVVLAPDERKRRDTFFSNALVLNYNRKLAEDESLWWKTEAANVDAFYRRVKDQNLNYFSVASGPAIETSRWGIEARGLFTYARMDQSAYLRAFGPSVSGFRALSDHALLAGGVVVESRKYYQDKGMDGLNASGYLGPVFSWGKDSVILRFGLEDQQATDRVNAYTASQALVRYERPLPLDLTLAIGYRFIGAHYKRADPRFGTAREDRLHEVSLGLRRKLWRNLSAEVGHTYVKSDSSIELYRYDRHLTSLSLSWEL